MTSSSIVRSEAGQTTTEYVMILGLITTVFISLQAVTQRPFHVMMQNLLQCIADGTTNQLPCEQTTMVGGGISAPLTPPASPAPGGLSPLLNQLQGVLGNITNILNTMLNGMQQTINNLRGAAAQAESWRQT